MKPFLLFGWALVTWPPEKQFSPITPQGCILPYVMPGDSESASKNTSKLIFKYPKYSNIRIFENSLASDLSFVYLINYILTKILWNFRLKMHVGTCIMTLHHSKCILVFGLECWKLNLSQDFWQTDLKAMEIIHFLSFICWLKDISFMITPLNTTFAEDLPIQIKSAMLHPFSVPF